MVIRCISSLFCCKSSERCHEGHLAQRPIHKLHKDVQQQGLYHDWRFSISKIHQSPIHVQFLQVRIRMYPYVGKCSGNLQVRIKFKDKVTLFQVFPIVYF